MEAFVIGGLVHSSDLAPLPPLVSGVMEAQGPQSGWAGFVRVALGGGGRDFMENFP